jgi:hypothetical protein
LVSEQAARIKNNRKANLLFGGAAAVNLASFNFCDAPRHE